MNRGGHNQIKAYLPCSCLLSCESRLLSCESATVRPAVLVLLSTDCLSLPVRVPVRSIAKPYPVTLRDSESVTSSLPFLLRFRRSASTFVSRRTEEASIAPSSTIRSAVSLDPATSDPRDRDPPNLDSSPLSDLRVSNEAMLARSSTSYDVDLEPSSTPRPPPRDPRVVDR
ncbi:hypothetical protein CRG98_036445 [Punica granatum]|uniref:Uncharacterized protein n=1 Tax=Punica granatum TaxID=22663 RepID=A0A2I0IGM3_PUNGR|nr:hypothetical protein CRG98_036445 [Punica granatum]